jgi:predicted RNA-binding protein YlqC (UPF0109 family)
MSSSLDTRLETWDDPTPRESEFSLKDLGEQWTHVRILVSDSEAGSIIGRGGSTVTALQSTSGALVKVSRRGQLLPGTGRRVLLVSGLFHQVMDAAEIILKKILYQVRYPALLCSAPLCSSFVSVQSDGLQLVA